MEKEQNYMKKRSIWATTMSFLASILIMLSPKIVLHSTCIFISTFVLVTCEIFYVGEGKSVEQLWNILFAII